eukprot:m.343337 g.343337  ORF g.343337 m.343337 type:complete len:228 (+) comp55778_c0_seq11:215-898(+)
MIARAVVLFIRDYVRLFFGCLECRKHFLELSEYVFTELDGSHHGQAALWLWKAHNMVNLRLLMERDAKSTDPMFPKQLYPTVNECSECQQCAALSKQCLRFPELASTAWNATAVTAHLRYKYGNAKHKRLTTTASGRVVQDVRGRGPPQHNQIPPLHLVLRTQTTTAPRTRGRESDADGGLGVLVGLNVVLVVLLVAVLALCFSSRRRLFRILASTARHTARHSHTV